MSSKIKVDTIENVAGSGNVSLGSGHNLVVPGNITGQGNATVGGTLGVTGVSTFSGNIGKVSSGLSPDIDFHIKTASGNPEARVESTGANYATYGLKNSSRAYSTQIRTDQGNAYVIRDETGGGNRLLISTAGYVTMPNQPFVRLRLSSHINSSGSTVNSPGNQVTGFTVIENVGSHWNSSNNNFTCPVAGVYQVSVFYIKYPQNGVAHVDLHKNGSFINAIRWRAPEAGTSYYQAGGTASVTCAANDVLDWHYFGGAGVHDENGSWEIKLSH